MDVYRISIIILKRYLDYWITSQFLLHLCNYNQLLRLKKKSEKRQILRLKLIASLFDLTASLVHACCPRLEVISSRVVTSFTVRSQTWQMSWAIIVSVLTGHEKDNSERKLFYYVYTVDGVACDHLMACLSRDFRHRNQTLLTIFLCQVSMSIFNRWIIGVF